MWTLRKLCARAGWCSTKACGRNAKSEPKLRIPVDRQREGIARAQARLHRLELAGRTSVARDRRVVYRGVAPGVDQEPDLVDGDVEVNQGAWDAELVPDVCDRGLTFADVPPA